MVMTTTKAFIVALAMVFIGFFWSTFFPAAPYSTMTTTVGILFGAYAGKRLAQKANWANGNKQEEK